MSKHWQSILTQIQRTATAKGRSASGNFSIEGTRLLERALRANASITAVLVSQSIWQNPPKREAAILQHLADNKTACYPIPDAEMNILTNGRQLGGFVGLLPRSTPIRLSDWLAKHPSPTLLVAVDVVDPGNIGGMMRTAHALGAGVFIAVGGSDPFHPRAVRTSMGSIFKVPIISVTLQELFAALRPYPIQMIGTVAENGVSLQNLIVGSGGTAVFMGSEYWGLPDEILNKLDQQLTIPMNDGIDSLSVNAAAAIVLYELKRKKDGSTSDL